MKNSSKGLKLRSVLAAAALAVAMTGALAGPVQAADWRRGHDWHDHEVHNHAWYVAHPHYAPTYVEAPPPVVYAPPPPSPGINLILPLNFH